MKFPTVEEFGKKVAENALNEFKYRDKTLKEWIDAIAEYSNDGGVSWGGIYRPQEQTGHWIMLDECSNSGYYCSECHKKVVKEGWSNTVKKIKYCPNCGAKMESEEQTE